MTDLGEIRTMTQGEFLTRPFKALKGYEEIQSDDLEPGEPSRLLISIVEEGLQSGDLEFDRFRAALEEAVTEHGASLDEAMDHIAHMIIRGVHSVKEEE